MQISYKNGSGIEVTLEGETVRDMYAKLANVEEIFQESCCGKCSSEDITHVVRTVDDNNFYEIRCNGCRAVLSLGCHKKGGTLFPKRKDADGKYLSDKGWVVWQG